MNLSHLPRLASRAFVVRLVAAAAISVAIPVGACTAAEDEPLGPRVYSAAPDCDYGEIFQGESKLSTYVLENRGDADLEIIQIVPKCGCNRYRIFAGQPRLEVLPDLKAPIGSKPVVVIRPGETIDLVVGFDATALPPRVIEKPIWIRSNDTTQPKYKLMAKAKIKLAVEVAPRPLQFDAVGRGEEKTLRSTVRPAEGVELNVTGASSEDAAFRVAVKKLDTADGSRAWGIDVTFTGQARVGLLHSKVTIQTDHSRLATISLPVIADVLSPVTFDPGRGGNAVRFGRLPGTGPVTRTIEVRNADPSVPYSVKEVQIVSRYDDKLSARVEVVEEGVHHRIRLTAKKNLRARFFRGTLIIFSEYPGLEKVMIPFMGQG